MPNGQGKTAEEIIRELQERLRGRAPDEFTRTATEEIRNFEEEIKNADKTLRALGITIDKTGAKGGKAGRELKIGFGITAKKAIGEALNLSEGFVKTLLSGLPKIGAAAAATWGVLYKVDEVIKGINKSALDSIYTWSAMGTTAEDKTANAANAILRYRRVVFDTARYFKVLPDEIGKHMAVLSQKIHPRAVADNLKRWEGYIRATGMSFEDFASVAGDLFFTVGLNAGDLTAKFNNLAASAEKVNLSKRLFITTVAGIVTQYAAFKISIKGVNDLLMQTIEVMGKQRGVALDLARAYIGGLARMTEGWMAFIAGGGGMAPPMAGMPMGGARGPAGQIVGFLSALTDTTGKGLARLHTQMRNVFEGIGKTYTQQREIVTRQEAAHAWTVAEAARGTQREKETIKQAERLSTAFVAQLKIAQDSLGLERGQAMKFLDLLDKSKTATLTAKEAQEFRKLSTGRAESYAEQTVNVLQQIRSILYTTIPGVITKAFSWLPPKLGNILKPLIAMGVGAVGTGLSLLIGRGVAKHLFTVLSGRAVGSALGGAIGRFLGPGGMMGGGIAGGVGGMAGGAATIGTQMLLFKSLGRTTKGLGATFANVGRAAGKMWTAPIGKVSTASKGFIASLKTAGMATKGLGGVLKLSMRGLGPLLMKMVGGLIGGPIGWITLALTGLTGAFKLFTWWKKRSARAHNEELSTLERTAEERRKTTEDLVKADKKYQKTTVEEIALTRTSKIPAALDEINTLIDRKKKSAALMKGEEKIQEQREIMHLRELRVALEMKAARVAEKEEGKKLRSEWIDLARTSADLGKIDKEYVNMLKTEDLPTEKKSIDTALEQIKASKKHLSIGERARAEELEASLKRAKGLILDRMITERVAREKEESAKESSEKVKKAAGITLEKTKESMEKKLAAIPEFERKLFGLETAEKKKTMKAVGEEEGEEKERAVKTLERKMVPGLGGTAAAPRPGLVGAAAAFGPIGILAGLAGAAAPRFGLTEMRRELMTPVRRRGEEGAREPAGREEREIKVQIEHLCPECNKRTMGETVAEALDRGLVAPGHSL